MNAYEREMSPRIRSDLRDAILFALNDGVSPGAIVEYVGVVLQRREQAEPPKDDIDPCADEAP